MIYEVFMRYSIKGEAKSINKNPRHYIHQFSFGKVDDNDKKSAVRKKGDVCINRR